MNDKYQKREAVKLKLCADSIENFHCITAKHEVQEMPKSLDPRVRENGKITS